MTGARERREHGAMTAIKPYAPLPLTDGGESKLTLRQQLAQVEKSLSLALEARTFWPKGEWKDAISSLERVRNSLLCAIRISDEATFGKAVLRPVFENIENGLTAKMIVRPPDGELDMPHITESVYAALRRCVGSGRIEVHAEYDVYVSDGGCVVETIPRFE